MVYKQSQCYLVVSESMVYKQSQCYLVVSEAMVYKQSHIYIISIPTVLLFLVFYN